MSSPTKKQIAQSILELSKKKSSKQIAKTLASYLANNHRTNELDAILREVANQREKLTGVSEVTLKSANKLDKKTEKRITALMDIDKYVINYVIDKDLVGGVRAEANGQVLDLTVRNRLNRLKEGATV